MSETLFTTLISFVCGYCVGYYFYELLRPKNLKKKFLNFFQVTIEKMDSLTHTLKNLSISDDWYSGEDLCKENQFLEKTKEKFEEVISSSNCSFYF